eukprot:scaffold41215_cov18-Prasinocladus_malaysianus.AAC.1
MAPKDAPQDSTLHDREEQQLNVSDVLASAVELEEGVVAEGPAAASAAPFVASAGHRRRPARLGPGGA